MAAVNFKAGRVNASARSRRNGSWC